MLYFAFFIFFLSIFFLFYGILTAINSDKIKIKKRFTELNELDKLKEEEIENKTFSERMIMPFYENFSKVLLRITPHQKIVMLNKKLERAGVLKNSTVQKWILKKSMIILIFSTILGVLVLMVDFNIMKVIVFTILVVITINVFFNFYLSKRIQNRKNKILKDLPYTLDLITVSVEAGLSFDGAIARVISNIRGELCDEFAKSLKEITMGIERKAALKNMSERCDVKELSMFISSLIQADELGVSLSKVLRIESANLREHRRQVSREKAMKAPIKMLFPLIFFIFPTIFIIILGPAVIRMITIFAKR
ncbi:type II secretion system F family protein [Clostridium autoethanogenum]|uniref:Type II secretion system F family protein n=1 Tax=Clostridium autoethanogenum TaxID=84023 RepID=A0A3M0SPS9_9CLOT|nr:type II secretion system F family protein [Clostridium autoethanogenum]RMD00366.1 type II secretion system F family protein [Clostridium autoethanogenum]